MDSNGNCPKVFISYSHIDSDFLDDFKKHLSILEKNNKLTVWTDKEIIVGNNDMFAEIDNRLKNSDIVCLFISANYFSSIACMKEKKMALDEDKYIVSVLLSHCLWKEDKTISNKPYVPTDANPITSFLDKDKAWVDVCSHLMELLNSIQEDDKKNADGSEEDKKDDKQIVLENKPEFLDFLNDAEIISKLHSKKERVYLNDIFVYPKLRTYNNIDELAVDERVSSDKIIDELCKNAKIIISGDSQSGKTALSKKFYTILRDNQLIPVLISAKTANLEGPLHKRIKEIFQTQYANNNDINFDNHKKIIVPIVDDFHIIRSKSMRERLITELNEFDNVILFVDDIFNISFRNAPLVNSFRQLIIRPFSPSQTNELISKWLDLNDKFLESASDLYKDIDKEKEIIDKALGKSFDKGLMPPYPFFIISILSSYETAMKSMDQNITSQGHCYHLLILMSLINQNVDRGTIDTYMNFLSLLAYYFYNEKKESITKDELDEFVKGYSDKYTFDDSKKDKIINDIISARLLNKNIFGMYSFKFPYVYYYFIAKYFADNFNANKKTIDNMIMNLHKDEYAYIVIFISHHIKNNELFDELQLNSMCLFDNVSPATLEKEEVSFLDDKIKAIIVKLPSQKISHEEERKKELVVEDAIEEEKENKERSYVVEDDDDKDEYARELRRGFKTVEVIGQVIKDRAGSIEKTRLVDMFENGMNIVLRNLTYFFDLIKDKRSEEVLVTYISSEIKKVIGDNEVSDDERNKQARELFWHLNFMVTNSSIHRIINSLCSEKLKGIIENTNVKIATPATFLIKHGALLRYDKVFNIHEIERYVKSDSCAATVKKIIALMVARHYTTNPISHGIRLKIAAMFGFKPRNLLIAKERVKEASKDHKD